MTTSSSINVKAFALGGLSFEHRRSAGEWSPLVKYREHRFFIPVSQAPRAPYRTTNVHMHNDCMYTAIVLEPCQELGSADSAAVLRP